MQKRSLGTIWSPANVCCVQFSSYSNHLLAFGSADYKVYCYDLRYVKTPLCTLAGHEKAVSYVKFMDSETIVSASTDNSLKLWDLNKTNSSGLSSGACSLTYKGHTNQKVSPKLFFLFSSLSTHCYSLIQHPLLFLMSYLHMNTEFCRIICLGWIHSLRFRDQ